MAKNTDSDEDGLRQAEREKYTIWYYKNEYWKEDNPNIENTRYRYDDIDHIARFDFLTDLIVRYFNFKNFLDVGCGIGHVVRNLLDKGRDGKGVEVSKAALDHYLSDLVKRGVASFAGAEKLPFKENSFDMVTCFDVMEHLPVFDTDRAISELIRVTRRYLVLTINLDNPCLYHPSMFSRNEWERKFLAGSKVRQLVEIQRKIEHECKQKHPEYDFFIFEKLQNNEQQQPKAHD
jgi:ubiquinone/menaquinone biosynthesis C-methylase UbiE